MNFIEKILDDYHHGWNFFAAAAAVDDDDIEPLGQLDAIDEGDVEEEDDAVDVVKPPQLKAMCVSVVISVVESS